MAASCQLLFNAVQARIHVVRCNLRSGGVEIGSARHMRISADCRTDLLRQLEMIPAIVAVDTSLLIEAIGVESLIAADRDAVVDCVNSKMRMDIVTSIGDNPEAPDGKQKQHNNYLHNYYTQVEWDYFRNEGAEVEVCLDKVARKIVDLRHRRAVEGACGDVR